MFSLKVQIVYYVGLEQREGQLVVRSILISQYS